MASGSVRSSISTRHQAAASLRFRAPPCALSSASEFALVKPAQVRLLTTSIMPWIPQRSLQECDTILCAPGMPHEMETRVVDGRLQRVYKNLWPSLRAFYLWASAEFPDSTYIVYENQRFTFGEVLALSLRAATIFKNVYRVQKGDRVAICSRNLPEYLVAWWACHLLGAVTVLVNAWLPIEPLLHCLSHTQSKVVILDVERLERISHALPGLRSKGVTGVLVFESSGRVSNWTGVDSWTRAMNSSQHNPNQILDEDPQIQCEDNATIIFTSGTTGLPKGVLSTQRQFLTNIRNATVAASRAHLRRGEGLPAKPEGPQRGLLVSVPFFHVTGTTSLTMLATSAGMKVILMRKWDPNEGRLIKEENIRIAGGVPSMVTELVESSLAGHPLDSLLFGGSPAPDQLPRKAKKAFPNTVLSQAYGMTETNSIAMGIAGEDYEARPTSAGLPCPVNDVVVVDAGGRVTSPGEVGEIWLRGPDIMQAYWNDPDATAKAITQDGWIKTGDLGTLDEEGFLYVRDRIKDLIIRGGENIASVSVENALYRDERLAEVAAVGVPDEKLGELVAAVVSTKPAYHDTVNEAELIDLAHSRLPHFAVPVMIVIQKKPFELTPSGKIVKASLRALAKAEWERRKSRRQNVARL